jgi:cell filamentation protein
MENYARVVLAKHIPCAGMDDARLVRALAWTHAEFILIHPFREGNGRLARLLNTMMALQAGRPEHERSAGMNSWQYLGVLC